MNVSDVSTNGPMQSDTEERNTGYVSGDRSRQAHRREDHRPFEGDEPETVSFGSGPRTSDVTFTGVFGSEGDVDLGRREHTPVWGRGE